MSSLSSSASGAAGADATVVSGSSVIGGSTV